MNQTRYYIRVGLALLIALALLLFTINFLRATFSFARNYRFNVAFDDIRGVSEGAKVQMAGVEIGSVENVELTRDNKARLRLRINEKYRIPVNSVFTISSGLLGGAAVVKVSPPPPGTAREDIAENEPNLRGVETATLESAFAKSEALLESFQRTASAVEKLATNEETQRDLQLAIRNLRLATESLPRLSRRVETQLDVLSRQSTRLVANLEEASESAPRLARTAENLSGDIRATLNENRTALRGLFQEANRTATAISGLTAQVEEELRTGNYKQNLRTVSENLTSITNRMDTVAGNIERLSSDPRLTTDIQQTVTNVREASASVKSLVQRLETIRIPGERRRSAPAGDGTPSPPPPRASASLLEPGLVVNSIYDTRRENLRVDSFFTLLGQEGRFYRVGLSDITETNQFNLQLGQSSGNTALRYGVIRGKLGAGLDARVGPLDLRLDVYRPNRPTADLRARTRLSDTASALLGIDSVGRDNRAVLGIQFSP